MIYIHGSGSDGRTYKAQVLRKHFPEMIAPDFFGPLALRLSMLSTIVNDQKGWILIGSSLGGLIAAIFTTEHPDQVAKVVLLAPALHVPEFSRHLPKPVETPAILVIGKKDDVIPITRVHSLTEKVFPRLTYLSVDDDHSLHHTAETLDWKALLA